MKRASITVAKNQLSALLDRVRHGETVVIEDRGVPVAWLSPIERQPAGPDRDQLLRLERRGILRPPQSTRPSRLLRSAPPAPAQRVVLSELVRRERGDGW